VLLQEDERIPAVELVVAHDEVRVHLRDDVRVAASSASATRSQIRHELTCV